MTKKILLKWLEARKAEALAQVDAQETAAKAALLAEKLERNLQFGGHIAIWYSPTWNLEFFQQANKRLHRRGQAETVLIHTLSAKGTIDERIYDIVLRNKEVGQNALLEAVKARIKEVT